MKIQLASDLHLEILHGDWPGESLIQPAPDADVLVLAGDIASGTDALSIFANWPSQSKPIPIIYVSGNHEFYGHLMEFKRSQMNRAAQRNHIHCLENKTVVIGNVRFLGATLWTDYRLDPDTCQVQQMERLERGLNDHKRIRTVGGFFLPADALDLHLDSRAWLMEELDKPWAGKTVVITHHGPHPQSVPARYANHPLRSGFVSDLSDILLSPNAPDLWLHGHVHDRFDYAVGRTRVVTNPAGYIRNRQTAESPADFEFENADFDPRMVVEV